MKFSERYLKMAAAAQEIQALRPKLPENRLSGWGVRGPECEGQGSIFAHEGIMECLHYDNDEDRWMIGGYDDDPDRMAWIPLLDQLLPMLGTPDALLEKWMDTGGDVSVSIFYEGAFEFNPQDWHESALLIIMHEKYGKVWNGAEWVIKP